MNEQAHRNRRTLVGKVVSDKMQKTVTVLVERKVKHPVIGKVLSRSKKYHAHVTGGMPSLGAIVEIEECAPMSRTKAWRVTSVLAANS